MPTIAVAGLLTLETSLRVERFPLHFAPIHYSFHGVRQTHAGVGFNVVVALGGIRQRERIAAA